MMQYKFNDYGSMKSKLLALNMRLKCYNAFPLKSLVLRIISQIYQCFQVHLKLARAGPWSIPFPAAISTRPRYNHAGVVPLNLITERIPFQL